MYSNVDRKTFHAITCRISDLYPLDREGFQYICSTTYYETILNRDVHVYRVGCNIMLATIVTIYIILHGTTTSV